MPPPISQAMFDEVGGMVGPLCISGISCWILLVSFVCQKNQTLKNPVVPMKQQVWSANIQWEFKKFLEEILRDSEMFEGFTG